MKTNLIICPNCEKSNKKVVLGELDKDGGIIILRYHHGATKVYGNSFSVICGECGELVFIKKGGVHENFLNRLYWFSRFQIGTISSPQRE